MSAKLSATFILNDKYSSALIKILDATNKADEATKKMTGSVNDIEKAFNNFESKGTSSLDTITNKMLKVVSVGVLMKKAFDNAWSGIKTAALQSTQENTIQALLKDDALGTGVYDWLSGYAKTSMLGREDLAKGFMSYNTVAKDMDEIERMIKMTERLYAKDPTQGAEGAVFAMKEVLSGDVISMRSRFGITGISGDTIRKFTDAGDTKGALDYIDQILNKFGATQDVVDKNSAGMLAQMNMFLSNFQTAFGESMASASASMIPVFQALQEGLDSGKYQPFFDVFATGTEIAITGISWLAQNISWLIPVVGSLTATIGAYKMVVGLTNIAQQVMTLNTLATTAAFTGLNATLVTCAWWLLPLLAALGVGAVLMGAFGKSASDAQAKIATGMTDQEIKTAYKEYKTLDVNVANTDPISVKGDVSIEEDNLAYLLDIAERNFVAQYSTATLAPQVNVDMKVEKTADVDELLTVIEETMISLLETEPEGVY